MASNFIPMLWSDLVFRDYDKQTVFAALANRDYEGEIRDYGDSVKINQIGEAVVNEYDGSVTYQTLDDAAKFLLIDQKQYTAIQVDDVKEAQSKPKKMGLYTEEMGIRMGEAVDEFLAGLHTEAGITTDLGDDTTAIEVTSANVVDYFALINQKMDENNIPTSGRVAVIPPWLFHKITLADIDKNTDNSAIITSGYRGNYLGFDLYMSNSIENTASAFYKPMFFRRNDTITFAQQIVKMEGQRLESAFADGLRALMVYGGKVVRPNSLAVLTCNNGDES
jgi:hypothetical protein